MTLKTSPLEKKNNKKNKKHKKPSNFKF